MSEWVGQCDSVSQVCARVRFASMSVCKKRQGSIINQWVSHEHEIFETHCIWVGIFSQNYYLDFPQYDQNQVVWSFLFK